MIKAHIAPYWQCRHAYLL